MLSGHVRAGRIGIRNLRHNSGIKRFSDCVSVYELFFPAWTEPLRISAISRKRYHECSQVTFIVLSNTLNNPFN